MSTAECGDTHEGKGEAEQTQTVFERMQKKKGREKGLESQFSEDLQTLLFHQLCLAAL